jgi:protease I
MALSDKKVLMVVPPDNFQDEEYDRLRRILEFNGITVKCASTHLGTLRGVKGTTVKSDVTVDDVKYYDYDAIIFVGGDGAKRLFDEEKVTKLAKDAEYKVLGAISTAPGILAKAGVLKGKKATCSVSVAGTLRDREATYTGQPVQVDDKIVTASGSQYAEQFGNAVLEVLRTK